MLKMGSNDNIQLDIIWFITAQDVQEGDREEQGMEEEEKENQTSEIDEWDMEEDLCDNEQGEQRVPTSLIVWWNSHRM